jgi:hypothetical protein
MWVAEDVPTFRIFPGMEDDGTSVREIIRHPSRMSAGKAMGHYLIALAGRPRIRATGAYALFHGAADLFKASGSTNEHMDVMVRIGSRVYRIRQEQS